jgi:hypothetical protein
MDESPVRVFTAMSLYCDEELTLQVGSDDYELTVD